jgi:hypothetical protein
MGLRGDLDDRIGSRAALSRAKEIPVLVAQQAIDAGVAVHARAVERIDRLELIAACGKFKNRPVPIGAAEIGSAIHIARGIGDLWLGGDRSCRSAARRTHQRTPSHGGESIGELLTRGNLKNRAASDARSYRSIAVQIPRLSTIK